MAQISRRTLLSRSVLLAGAVVGVGVGFLRPVHSKVTTPPPAPPAGLTDALARQQALLAGYQRIPEAPAGLKSDVTAHGQALRALLELYPGWRLARQAPSRTVSPDPIPATGSSAPAGSGSAAPGNIAELASSSAALSTQLLTTVQGWPATEPNAIAVVSTLASISAALNTHAAVLT